MSVSGFAVVEGREVKVSQRGDGPEVKMSLWAFLGGIEVKEMDPEAKDSETDGASPPRGSPRLNLSRRSITRHRRGPQPSYASRDRATRRATASSSTQKQAACVPLRVGSYAEKSGSARGSREQVEAKELLERSKDSWICCLQRRQS